MLVGPMDRHTKIRANLRIFVAATSMPPKVDDSCDDSRYILTFKLIVEYAILRKNILPYIVMSVSTFHVCSIYCVISYLAVDGNKSCYMNEVHFSCLDYHVLTSVT